MRLDLVIQITYNKSKSNNTAFFIGDSNSGGPTERYYLMFEEHCMNGSLLYLIEIQREA